MYIYIYNEHMYIYIYMYISKYMIYIYILYISYIIEKLYKCVHVYMYKYICTYVSINLLKEDLVQKKTFPTITMMLDLWVKANSIGRKATYLSRQIYIYKYIIYDIIDIYIYIQCMYEYIHIYIYMWSNPKCILYIHVYSNIPIPYYHSCPTESSTKCKKKLIMPRPRKGSSSSVNENNQTLTLSLKLFHLVST